MNADEIVKFDREKSDWIFTETLNDLDNLNTRDGRFEYADYVTLHNDITALYDSFSYVDEVIESLSTENARLRAELADAKESLKRKCLDELAAVKCISDIETYLELGSAKYIKITIDDWRGTEGKA